MTLQTKKVQYLIFLWKFKQSGGLYLNPRFLITQILLCHSQIWLVNLYFTAQKNYHAYLIDDDYDLLPVFVIFDDEIQFNDINNWTITKTDTEILQSICKIQDDNDKNKTQMIF